MSVNAVSPKVEHPRETRHERSHTSVPSQFDSLAERAQRQAQPASAHLARDAARLALAELRQAPLSKLGARSAWTSDGWADLAQPAVPQGSQLVPSAPSGQGSPGARAAGMPQPDSVSSPVEHGAVSASVAASTDTALVGQAPVGSWSEAQTPSAAAPLGSGPALPIAPAAPTDGGDLASGLPTVGESAQHCGSVPVLVAGQLVELDLYAVPRRSAGAGQRVNRLVLSLAGRTGEPVRLMAQLSQNRLLVSSTDPARPAAEDSSEQIRAVAELAARLGWRFDSVTQMPLESAVHAKSAGAGAQGDGRLDRLL
jgi:hypothetical protein